MLTSVAPALRSQKGSESVPLQQAKSSSSVKENVIINWVFQPAPTDCLGITISTSQFQGMIQDLRRLFAEKILEEYHFVARIDARFRFFKPVDDIPVRDTVEDNWLENVKLARIPGANSLAKAISNEKVENKDILHLVVTAEKDTQKAEESDVVTVQQETSSPRQNFFARNLTKPPSSEAKLSNMITTQNNDQRALLYGRPANREATVPASLFNETLCQLRHDLNTVTPSTDDIRIFRSLRTALTGIFPHEDFRRDELIRIMTQILPDDALLARGFIPGTKYHTNGDIRLLVGAKLAELFYYIQEVKNEVTTGKAEPLVEAICYWIELIRACLATDKFTEDDLKRLNFPVIILLHFGPYLALAVGTFTHSSSQPNIEHLTCIPLHAHSNTHDLEAGERFVASLRLALHRLQNYYATFGKSDSPLPCCDFPFRDFFEVGDKKQKFIYDEILEDKKVFRARLVDDKQTKLYVKFTQRYSELAHRSAFECGNAPKLLAVNQVYGWHMVVMEDVSANYVTYYDLKSQQGSSALESTRKCVTQAVNDLHLAGFVHGDIRDVNILVKRPEATEDGANIMLIDWDWAGVANQARYPHNLNSAVSRSKDAVPGGIITTQHDLEMLLFLE